MEAALLKAQTPGTKRLGAEAFLEPSTFCARARAAAQDDPLDPMVDAVFWCDQSDSDSREIFDNMVQRSMNSSNSSSISSSSLT